MADETVELGINNSPISAEQPKCTKCVDPVKESERYKEWFSKKNLRTYFSVSAILATLTWLIVIFVAWAITSNQQKAIVIAIWPTLGAFVGLMLFIVGSGFNGGNLYVAYEKETGRPHFHRKPFPQYLKIQEDLTSGERSVQKRPWLLAPILHLPLCGGCRRPASLRWNPNDRLEPVGPFDWQPCRGSIGLLGVILRNPGGDRVVIPSELIVAPFTGGAPHVLDFLRSGPRESAAEAYFERRKLLKETKEAEDLALQAEEAQRQTEAELTIFRNYLDYLGRTTVGVVRKLRKSKGERKSRPAELAGDELEAGLVVLPPKLVERWREEVANATASTELVGGDSD